ncbi:ADP-ribosylation factor-like [Brachionus plicatilis]|uniref:ADP-ribosylation factor-like n=1 Tax=Brachionus plicatilis TaxID=10195 RepID=A0A3M7Q6Y0_BRAPC|nr:ADP-ribosylation factor-like [Brachionus plicatilis]
MGALNTKFGGGDKRKLTAQVLILGLNHSGKTTIFFTMRDKHNIFTIPAIGFNSETFITANGVSMRVCDLGNYKKVKPTWKDYFQESIGCFFVVDSTDEFRLDEAAQELHGILEDDSMRGVPVVVIANKQDLPNAITCTDLVQKLNLEKLSKTQNKWFIQSACALTGEGIYEAMEQMGKMVKENQK